METTGNWYYQEHGQTNGPLVSEELLKLFDSGQITPETPVRQARKEWQTASIASVHIRYESYPHISEFRRILGNTLPRPLLRFLARAFDAFLCVHFTLLSIAFIQQHWTLSLGAEYFLSSFPVIYIASFILLESLFINLFGTTPGKYLLSIHIRKHDGTKLGIFKSIQRSTLALGIGCGFFLYSLTPLLLLACGNHLQHTGHTPWDTPDSQQVVHFPVRTWRVVAALGIILWLTWVQL